MPVVIGTHSNGARYARATISGDGFAVVVEGTGVDDDVATARLANIIRRLGEACSDIADEMAISGEEG